MRFLLKATMSSAWWVLPLARFAVLLALKQSDRSWLRVALHQYTCGLRRTFFFLLMVASQVLPSIFMRSAAELSASLFGITRELI